MRETPALSVSIITRNSGSRLAESIAQARRFADEVVVGVDADSHDNTWDVATRFADTAYRFKHPNQLAPAHLLPFQYCRGQWVLRLDDDEYMEPGFEQILPELLATRLFTHYHLSRKWVVSLDPPEYIHAWPWYPGYTPRLIRNDSTLVWKPPRYHSGLLVAGSGALEARFAILHYEPLLCSPEMRERKLKVYREGGSDSANEVFYGEKMGERRSFQPPVSLPPARPPEQRIDPDVQLLSVQQFPPWGCKFLAIDFPQSVAASQTVIVTLRIRNTGNMSWLPQQTGWPIIMIAFHVKSPSGAMLQWEGTRIALSSLVRPNETTDVLAFFIAPPDPGDYILTWDMVSEFECWFEQCGSETFDTHLTVTQA